MSKARRPWQTGILWLLAVVLIGAFVFATTNLVRWQREIRNAQISQSTTYKKFSFDPGYIISDEQFFDSQAMTTAEIQSFLDDKGTLCSGSTCIKNAEFDVEDMDADAECATRYEAPESRQATAAQIISGAAQSCGISPKVLLVLLQKEQHLVQSATAPSHTQLDAATGLSCPDTADCDARYKGFFKQVYGAARRFKCYLNHSSSYHYHWNSLNRIQYSPNVSCGSSDVYIYNKATALLYIYTPYQPNKAALESGDGEGDECSSYGNRNFSIIYNQFFGSPVK
ncbi:hemagglutinin [Alloscardovia venturai]|uniref:Hemagglutinin n=1 Tax=Alloscardovia venturai TaxID=1769421 RepID=A0ABW2Y4R0_9BIFI